MKILFRLTAAVLSFYFISCSSNSNSALLDFPETERITGNVCLPDLFLGNPFLLCMADNQLFIRDSHDGKMVTQVDLTTNESYRIASRGEGPCEFMNIRNISYNSKDRSISFFDGVRFQSSSYKIGKGALVIEEPNRLSSICIEQAHVFDIIPFSKGYLANGIFGYQQLCYFDKSGNVITTFGAFPGDNSGIENSETFFLRKQTQISVSPDQQKFAITGVYNDQLSFYKAGPDLPAFVKEYYTSESELKTFESHSDSDSQYGVAETDNTIFTYKSACPTDNYLYVIYWGYNQAQIDRKEVSGCKILLFDWNGNKIKCMEVPNLLFQLAVDENGGSIYGLTYPLSDNSVLMEYKIHNP